jgi:hypothetical protein
MRHPRTAITILTCAALLAGCAATVNQAQPGTATLSVAPAAAARVVLQMTPPPASGNTEDWRAFREEWQTSMSAAAAPRAASFKLLNDGEAPPAEAATLLKMKVNDYRYVSQAKRFAIGVFSGNAFMDIDVEFVELPSGKVLGTRKYGTSSSAWQGVFSAMTPKQVEAVSQEIFKDLGKR